MNYEQFSRSLIRPLVELLAKTGVSPNVLTVLSALLTAGGSILIATGRPLWAAIWLATFAPLDALDGGVARLTGRTSRFGAFLDSTLDRLTDGLLFSAMAYHFRGEAEILILSLVALISAYLISYIRARVEGLGGSLREGLMSRYPRFLGLLALLLIWWAFGRDALLWGLGIYDILLVITVVQRMYLAYVRLR
ncbi:MAG: CDP-alcohol phosphatidyltransferase family protein [Thermotogae bacterium]|nr:CDP-alcohol phosphatidyltransferase family protein [Thermotogota bacterium]